MSLSLRVKTCVRRVARARGRRDVSRAVVVESIDDVKTHSCARLSIARPERDDGRPRWTGGASIGGASFFFSGFELEDARKVEETRRLTSDAFVVCSLSNRSRMW